MIEEIILESFGSSIDLNVFRVFHHLRRPFSVQIRLLQTVAKNAAKEVSEI